MSWQAEYIARFYRNRPSWLDGTEEFHQLCRRYISSESRALEIGAGPANRTSEFLSLNSRSVTGLDLSESVKENRFLTEARVYDGGTFPFPDASFDVAVSDYTLEHVIDPLALCQEIRRVLAPAGVFLFRTPNVLHYVSVLSRVLPDRLSVWARQMDGHTPETHPKYFRFNSERRCRRTLADAGFSVLDLRFIEKEPSYGMRSRLLFLPMMAYERVVNSTDLLRRLRANILCAAAKT